MSVMYYAYIQNGFPLYLGPIQRSSWFMLLFIKQKFNFKHWKIPQQLRKSQIVLAHQDIAYLMIH